MWGMEDLVAAEIRSWGRATPETTLFPPEELARTSEKRLIIGSGACRCQIRSQSPEGGQLAEGGLMALWRAVSPQVSGEGAVGGTTHDIFPSKLFVSPIASDRDGVLEGQGGVENRSAAVVDRSVAETTLLPPSVRSSEKGVRSPKPAMDNAHRRGFPARKTTLACPARTRTCEACKAINDASARICQVAPYSTPLLKLTSVSLARLLAEHRRYLASHGLACPSHWLSIVESLHRTDCMLSHGTQTSRGALIHAPPADLWGTHIGPAAVPSAHHSQGPFTDARDGSELDSAVIARNSRPGIHPRRAVVGGLRAVRWFADWAASPFCLEASPSSSMSDLNLITRRIQVSGMAWDRHAWGMAYRGTSLIENALP